MHAKEGAPSYHMPIEEVELFKTYVAAADGAWKQVRQWPPLAVDTVGKQLVRAIDRVGATLVEGDGRYSDAEAAHFFVIARGSARETRYWLLPSAERQLVAVDAAREQVAALDRATRQLNGLIRYRRSRVPGKSVRDGSADYDAGDPFAERTAPSPAVFPTPDTKRPTP